MKNNPKACEIIGKNITVTGSKNSSAIGLRGKVIDETKNTITIKTKKGERKKLAKSQITFKMETNCSNETIIGREIIALPEERIKIR